MLETKASPTTARKQLDSTSEIAQNYYDSDDAFHFYKQVWGGEFIHVGLYDDLDCNSDQVERIKEAARQSCARLFVKSGRPVSGASKVMDLGSAYGGTARFAARAYGCSVTCIDISSKENAVNRAETEAAGLSELVRIPGELSFFDTEEPDASHDLVISQDSLLHAGSERHKAIAEAARVLKPGGFLVFTDIMQTDNADASQLDAVYKRIHLEDMGSPGKYRKWGEDSGLTFIEYEDRTQNLAVHYGSVCKALEKQRAELTNISSAYIDNMIRGLNAWVDAAGKDNLSWGYLVFQKPE